MELDIMSPHYQPYYREGKEPGDWYDPKPIFFLAVPRGIEFHFALAYREMSREQLEKAQNQKLLENARALLCEALKEHGVGAKTALGYGRMIDE
ncbi:type III-B CRISPR module RAMP protein Cmr6 [Methermicoccus shengliensis]|uniref:Type III-B CRISPR module RAMP protein Cmr6 n=1 Tax=Methermicoccus shengliensis TaxID=660064 RepID=A0A832RXJ7_9EURY|nr:type III-B CRISPR module RAMP protein Cmr6 [Methermicoccus shengliensis]